MDHIGVLYKFHDRPITYLYNTLHYFEHRIRERHTLKKTLVSSIIGSLKDVRPPGWCLTEDYQQLLERSPKDEEEWKLELDYYVRLVGRLVRSLQVYLNSHFFQQSKFIDYSLHNCFLKFLQKTIFEPLSSKIN